MHIWQSKQVLKSGSQWKKPSWVGNRPKGVSKEEWERDIKEWRHDKLLVLDKVPRVSKKTNNTERNNNNDNR